MSSEALDFEPMDPHRANVAMLTLQLQSLRHDLEIADAADGEADLQAALAQLRARLERLVDERRRALESELDRARTEAADAIEAARAEAAAIVARTSEAATVRRDATMPAAFPPPVVAGAAAAAEVPLIEGTSPAALPEQVPQIAVPLVTAPAVAVPASPADHVWSAPMLAPPVVTMQAGDTVGRDETSPVLVDAHAFAEAFAEAFARAFVAALEDMLAPKASSQPVLPVLPPTPQAATTEPSVAARRSGRARVLEADVLMSLAAIIAVLVVLVVWST